MLLYIGYILDRGLDGVFAPKCHPRTEGWDQITVSIPVLALGWVWGPGDDD